MKKYIVIIIGLLLFNNVYALDYVKNAGCTLTNEYIEWLKLPDAERRKVIEPNKCEETIKYSSINIINSNVSSIDNVDYKTLSKFDLRNVSGKSYVTPQKDQDNTNLCWTFATNSVIESAALVEGGSALDLSEKHIAFNTTYKIDDGNYNPLGFYSNTSWDVGGNYLRSGEYLISGRGPVLESKLPWSTTKSTIDNATKLKADYSVDEVKIASNSRGACSEDSILNIKYLLTNYGAVAANMYGGSVIDSIDDYISNDKTSYYYNGTFQSNHAVTIVGWDDNYSKEKFSESKSGTPTGDGAWIIKNTYSSLFPGDDYLDPGYHYISYYDKNICSTYMSANGIKSKNASENNYYYDSLGFTGFVYSDNKDTYFKEIYTKKSTNSEILTKISLLNYKIMNNDDKYEIYFNLVDDFATAKKIAEGVMDSISYKTIYLSSPITITTDKYYIYMKYTSAEPHCVDKYTCSGEEAKYYFPAEVFTTDESLATNTLPYKPSVQNGVSFYSYDTNTWIDTLSNSASSFYPILHAFTIEQDFNIELGIPEPSDDKGVNLDNKGYFYIPVNLTNINKNDLKIAIYNSKNENVTNTFDISEYLSGYKISLTDNTKADTYAVKFFYNGLETSSSITVAPKTNILVTSISISGGNELSVNGTLNLTASVLPDNATNKGIKWTSSNENIATVSENGIVKGIKAGTAQITASTLDDSNVKETIEIKVIDINLEEGNGPTEPNVTSTDNNQSANSVQNPKTGLNRIGYILIASILLSTIIYIEINKKKVFKKI